MRIITVQDIATLVNRHGFGQLMLDLMLYLKQDFTNWQHFDKSPRHATHVPDGVIELMPISDNQFYTFKYVNGHPKNPLTNKQTVIATGQLSNITDGYPEIISEMTLLTGLRTAATAAIATDLLARQNSKTIAIIGTGAQSEFQVRAQLMVRDIKTIKYFDTDPEAMTKFAKNITQIFHNKIKTQDLQLIACDSAEEAVKNADIITVCTACKGHVNVIHNDWIANGVHINGLGGDCPGKTELEASILPRSKIIVEYLPQTIIEGEIQQLTADEINKLVYAELWELITGNKNGRINDNEITLFDSVGFAIEDFSVLRLTNDLTNQYNIGYNMDLVPQITDPKDLISALNTNEYDEEERLCH